MNGVKKLSILAILTLTLLLSGCDDTPQFINEGDTIIEYNGEPVYTQSQVDSLIETQQAKINDLEQKLEYMKENDIYNLEQRIIELENPFSLVLENTVGITLVCDTRRCELKIYDDDTNNYISLDIRQLDETTVYIDIDMADKDTHRVSATTYLEVDTLNEDYKVYSTFLYYLAKDYGTTFDDIYDLYLAEYYE